MSLQASDRPVLLAGFPAGLAVWLSLRLDGRPVEEETDLARAAERALASAAVVVDARDDPGRAVQAIEWAVGLPVVACLGKGIPAPPGLAAVLRHPLDRERLAQTLQELLAARARPPAGDPTLHEMARPLLEERLSTIERRLAAVLAGRQPAAALAGEAPRAHALLGSLRALGYDAEGRQAAEAEAILKDPRRADLERLAGLLRNLRASLARPHPAPRPPARGRVLAVSRDPAVLREWVVLGAAQELLVATCGPDEAVGRLAKEAPDVLLVDDPDVPRDLVAEALSRRPIVPVVLRTRLDEVDLPGVRTVPRDRSPAAALAAARESLPARATADLGTILLVDDDPVSLALLRRLVEAVGGRAVAMEDPAEALSSLSRISPAAVIVDLQMEPISGEEFARMLRRDARWRDVPLLCVTGDDSLATRRRLLAVGVDDVLVKPPGVDVLRARLRSLLRAPHLVDPASGVPTATLLEALASSLLDIARREMRPLALALVVHRSGDAAASARRLRERVAREHLVARLSPTETAVLAYGLSAKEARALVAPLAAEEDAVGVAAHPQQGSALGSLVEAARRDALEASEGGWSVAAQGPAQRRVDVAIVESDPIVAGVVAKALEDAGLTTRTFADGAEAAAMLAGERPPVAASLVLTEVSLPGLDGFTLLRALQASRPAPRVILLTTRASEPEVLQAFEMGAFDHVPKPFSLPILLHRVRRALEA